MCGSNKTYYLTPTSNMTKDSFVNLNISNQLFSAGLGRTAYPIGAGTSNVVGQQCVYRIYTNQTLNDAFAKS